MSVSGCSFKHSVSNARVYYQTLKPPTTPIRLFNQNGNVKDLIGEQEQPPPPGGVTKRVS